VVPLSKAVAFHEDRDRPIETSSVWKGLQASDNALRNRDIPPKIGVMPSRAYDFRAVSIHSD
jgi:hypothetical protein